MEVRPIDAEALYAPRSVRKVTEYDETGCGMDYLAVPWEVIQNAPTLDYVPRQQWISVKDRLPGINEYVLMRSHSCGTDIGFRMDDEVFGCDVGYYLEIGDVTHWMLLPKPPKEDE